MYLIRVSKNTKQKPFELQRETANSTLSRDFNMPLSTTGRINKQKIVKDTDVNNTLNQRDLIDIDGTFLH